MAIIKYFPRPYRIGGHRGSTVFSNNFAGNFIRTRKMPLLKRQDNQSQNRSNFRHVVQFWKTLTPAEVNQWTIRHNLFFTTLATGKVINPKDPIRFTSDNLSTVYGSDSVIVTAADPVIFPSRQPDSIGISLVPIQIFVQYIAQPIPAGFTYKFHASQLWPIKQSLFFQSDFRFIQEFTVDQGEFYDITNAFLAAFPQTPPSLYAIDLPLYSELVFSMRNIATGQEKVMNRTFIEFYAL